MVGAASIGLHSLISLSKGADPFAMAATQFAQCTLAAKPAVASRPARRSVKVSAAAYNGAYAEELVATAVRMRLSSAAIGAIQLAGGIPGAPNGIDV
jgi:hypothetical protein